MDKKEKKSLPEPRTYTVEQIAAMLNIGRTTAYQLVKQEEFRIVRKPLGKYGRMRKTYLKEHRPILYNQMLLSEKLYPHLIEIDETAQSRLEQMMPQLAKEAGATEELKASDPMKWVGLMNTCKAQAEEILMAELINS